MNFLQSLTLNYRKKKFGKLLNSYSLLDGQDRDKLIAFISDEKKWEGIDINSFGLGDVDGPCLFLSILRDDYELFSLLLNHGSNKDIVFQELTVPFLIFNSAFDMRFFEFLANENFDFNREFIKGITPLGYIMFRINQDKKQQDEKTKSRIKELRQILDFLLKRNIDVNDGGKNQYSPIMMALKSENIEILNNFIYGGADLNQTYYIKDLNQHLNFREYLEKIKNKLSSGVYEQVFRMTESLKF